MQKKLKNALFDLYSDAKFFVRFYVGIRLKIAEFDHILTHVPQGGRVLDVGCGYGVLSNLIALSRPGVTILGVDNNTNRISVAQSTIRDRENILFETGDAQRYLIKQKFTTVILFDVLHHIPKEIQVRVLLDILKSLPKNGTVLLKEIRTRPFWKYSINYFHDRLFNGPPLHFRSAQEWQAILRQGGVNASMLYYGGMYPHVLLYGKKVA